MEEATASASRMRVVVVDGHRLRVSVRPGTEPCPPLLICNGIGASLDLLEPFVETLDERIEVVRFDVPGVGGSPDPVLPYTFASLAWLVSRLMTRLGYGQFDVLGISWGGALAQQLAFQHRRRCRRVVLVATGTGMLMVPARPSVLAAMVTPRRYRDPAFAQEKAPDLYGGTLREDPAAARHLLHDHTRVGSQRGYLLQLLAGAGWTSLPFLPLIRQPVLLLAGSDDPLIPTANARIMHRLLPHSELEFYDDGHLALVTRADLLAPRIAGFLRGR